MEKTKKIFCGLLLFIPVFLITGPAIPDIIITFSSIFFLILIFLNKTQNEIAKLRWFKISIIFWIFLIISSFFAYNFTTAFTESIIFIRFLLIPIVVLIILFEYQLAIKLLFVTIFVSVVFVIFDTFFLSLDDELMIYFPSLKIQILIQSIFFQVLFYVLNL